MAYEFPTSRSTFLIRGITHACPRCGSRKTHTKYFSIRKHCPRCSLVFEKEAGYWTGSLAINIVFTGGVLIFCLAALLIATAPAIPVIPIVAVLAPVAILLPIISYPFTHTLWMAIDYGFMSRLDK